MLLKIRVLGKLNFHIVHWKFPTAAVYKNNSNSNPETNKILYRILEKEIT